MNEWCEEEAVVIGAGLVGSLLASVLARRGHRVAVYESRADPRESSAAGGRSINLVLTRRGIRALERVGLADGALALSVPVTGRMVHALDGSLAYQPYGRDASECNHSISRAGLNRYLIDEAERCGARFGFGRRLEHADLESGTLELIDDGTGARERVDARVVFGADGAGSALREAFGTLPGFEESVEMLSHGYKELLVPPDDGGGYRLEREALHIWPRGTTMLMALANLDGSFTGTAYLPFAGDRGFDRLVRGADAVALFREEFPDALACIPDLEHAWAHNPTGKLGTVRCRPWHHAGRALLLGDAAHAIVPFFGQGMNLGFEDCRVLDDLLDAHGDDSWATVFAKFSDRRKPDADAIAAMALENFVEMRDLVGDPVFLLRKAVEHRLETEFPLDYRSRYSMVMYSHVPFELCRRAGEIQRALLDDLCAGLSRAEDLDLARAREVVGERFAPFLRRHEISLDY